MEIREIRGKLYEYAVKYISGDKYNMSQELYDQLDLDGVDWNITEIITGCRTTHGRLYSATGNLLATDGLVDGLYYCDQSCGYIGDDYSGWLYYKTNINGVFVVMKYYC